MGIRILSELICGVTVAAGRCPCPHIRVPVCTHAQRKRRCDFASAVHRALKGHCEFGKHDTVCLHRACGVAAHCEPGGARARTRKVNGYTDSFHGCHPNVHGGSHLANPWPRGKAQTQKAEGKGLRRNHKHKRQTNKPKKPTQTNKHKTNKRPSAFR